VYTSDPPCVEVDTYLFRVSAKMDCANGNIYGQFALSVHECIGGIHQTGQTNFGPVTFGASPWGSKCSGVDQLHVEQSGLTAYPLFRYSGSNCFQTFSASITATGPFTCPPP
jgi:hypothetical protein